MASSQTGQTSVDTTDIFTTNQKFATREDVVNWAREVGYANKVSIIISRSDKKNGKRGRSDKLILGCDKGGKYDVESSKVTLTKKCNCPFKIRATPSIDGSGWKVQVKCGVHNHGLPDQYEGHPRVGRLTEDEKKYAADLTKLNVAPRHIQLSLKEKNPDSVTSVTQLYKHRSMLQKAERGRRTEMQQLMQMLDEGKYVSWNRRRDDGSDVLRDVFWAHPDSIKLLNMFPIVLIMDCTYKTNKYRQPLLEIVGITSTEMTFNVGFAYLECEQTDNYSWALEKLKGLFIKEDLFPQVILTDRELALMNAIEVVFSHTANLLCVWHINKNVGKRCRLHVEKDMRECVIDLWNEVIYCPNEVEYQHRLNAFEQACVNSSKFVDYVKDTWLTPHRHRFVAAWTNQVMHLGNTTTNRVESTHWNLKLMLENSKGDLCKCLKDMDKNIILQVSKIKASFQKSFYYTERLHNSPFFQNLRSFVSRDAMTLIAEEFERVDIVGTDKNICGCVLRITCGLPCACELGGYRMNGVPITIDSVHGHWKKLSMEAPLEDDTEDGYELDMSHAIDAIWSRFRSLDIVGKRALKSKMFEIAYLATSSLCPPPEKIKHKGGVKKDKRKAPKGYDVYRDLSYFEYGERDDVDSQQTSKRVCTSASQKQPSQSSQKQLSQPSQKQLSQSSQKQLSQLSQKKPSHQYLVQFPNCMHPYITDIIDVEKDGNCGFRAIASLLGYTEDGWPMVRRELDIELKNNNSLYEQLFGKHLQGVRDKLQISGIGAQLEDRWFTIPAMGYLVANKYNVILVTLGNPSTTFFPMMTSYSSLARIFCIGYVGGNHWVQVNMKSGFPLPGPRDAWMKLRSLEATSWMTEFTGRRQHWQRLTRKQPINGVIEC